MPLIGIENDKDIRSLLDAARKFARRHGYENDADDFAQETYISCAKGRCATFKQLFIDYLRRYYGCTRVLGGIRRSFETHGRMSLDAPIRDGSSRTYGDVVAGIGVLPECEQPTWPNRVFLEGKGRLADIYDAVIIDGASHREIAEDFGVDESRISQQMSEIRKDVRSAMVLDEAMDRYRDEPEFSKLSVDWITL